MNTANQKFDYFGGNRTQNQCILKKLAEKKILVEQKFLMLFLIFLMVNVLKYLFQRF